MVSDSSYPVDISIKKMPRQARSKATFDAIIQASAWVLLREGYAATTTNRIADKAGVNIASLYEYFPNKESIIAVLAERELTSYIARVANEIKQTRVENEAEMVAHMIYWGVDEIQKNHGLLSILMLEVPFVQTLPSTQSAMASAVTVIQMAMRDDERVRMATPEVDAWLLTRMCFNTALEIASNQIDDERRSSLLAAFVSFSFRMLFARDPNPAEAAVMDRHRLNR